MRIYLIILMIIFSCISCSPIFYQEVKSTFPERNHKALYFRNNSDKEIFKKLKERLKHSNHIIYHFSPNGTTLGGNGFSAVVIDVENSKYYLLKREDGNKIILKETTNQIDNSYHKFVIENYQKGNVKYLQEIGEKTFYSGINTTDGIYEINLKNHQRDRYTFKTLFFEDGKPYVDGEPYTN